MEKKRVFVLPGEIALTKQPTVIATLLGSCVAVCLFNKKGKFGGMNHFMLPDGNNKSIMGKYGDYSTQKLIDSMLRADPDKKNIVAKIYGGGTVIGHLAAGGMDIGKRNIEIALRILSENGIRVSEQDVAGDSGRKIFFDNQSGEVELRMIQKSSHTIEMERKKNNLTGRKIRTLIVDDSPTVRSILKKALADDPEIEVIGEAEDAFEARSKILELDPDVITLDIIMPKLDGVSFLKKLLIHYPKPVIIVSSIAQKGSKIRLRAQEIGAVDVVDKEELKLYQGIETVRKVLSAKVKMAATKIVQKKQKEEIANI